MKIIKALEIASITALTTLFIVFASINLGSVGMPSSSWQPISAGEEEVQVVFDFGSVQQIKEIYIFLGDDKRTKFEVYGRGTPPDNWMHFSSYDNDPANHVHFCSWERISLGNKSAGNLKFVFGGQSEGKIGEILVISTENKKIEPVEVSGENAAKLVDEQDMIKLPVTQKYGAYFDEMYFVRTAWEHLNLKEPYETTHPPLGKLIIASGIMCFGMDPFGWRIFGVLAAAAMIPVMFLFGKRMFKSSAAGFIAAFLMTFEFMHFSLARLATGEIYIALFSLVMFYFAFDHFSKREEGEKGRFPSLFFSIVFFGLCFAVKWIAIFGLVAILILLLICNVRTKKPVFSDFEIVLAGLFVSGAIYIATYIPYMFSGAGHSLFDVLKSQLGMFGYHAYSVLDATHPFSSPWWSWPLMLKPLWLYSNTFDSMLSTIVLMGNPLIWWCSIPALIFIAIKFVVDKKRKTDTKHNFVFLFILIPFLLQWLPYILITRILFIYHFVANVPFMIFALTYWLNLPLEKEGLSTGKRVFFICIVIAFLILTAVLFLHFYPVISGCPVTYDCKESLKWLSGWSF